MGLERPGTAQVVTSHGGFVVAGGADLVRLRKGAQAVQRYDLPEGTGRIHAVAVEPRWPWRYAFAWEQGVRVILPDGDRDRCTDIEPPPGFGAPTHLGWAAWAREPEEIALQIGWENGDITRVTDRFECIFDLPFLVPMAAFATDDQGSIAGLSFAPEPDGGVYVIAGEHCDLHFLTCTEKPRGPSFVAVAGRAFAVSPGDGFLYGTWDPDAEHARGTLMGPWEPLQRVGAIAFEGSARDAALFLGTRITRGTSVYRMEPDGVTSPVVDLTVDEGSDAPAPEITGLAWDASRSALWIASPEVGLLMCSAPDGPAGMASVN